MSDNGSGIYWGNNLHDNASGADGTLPADEWVCMEYMVKMNSPLSSSNGELQAWINDVETVHYANSGPTGTETNGVFFPGDGSDYIDLKWRDLGGTVINFLWLDLWVPSSDDDGNGKLWLDDLVVASSRIGCTTEFSGPTPTASPTGTPTGTPTVTPTTTPTATPTATPIVPNGVLY
jgi:hypothetical protein